MQGRVWWGGARRGGAGGGAACTVTGGSTDAPAPATLALWCRCGAAGMRPTPHASSPGFDYASSPTPASQVATSSLALSFHSSRTASFRAHQQHQLLIVDKRVLVLRHWAVAPHTLLPCPRAINSGSRAQVVGGASPRPPQRGLGLAFLAGAGGSARVHPGGACGDDILTSAQQARSRRSAAE